MPSFNDMEGKPNAKKAYPEIIVMFLLFVYVYQINRIECCKIKIVYSENFLSLCARHHLSEKMIPCTKAY